MSYRAETKRDAFTFSLGGLTTIASFVPAPAVAHDRIRTPRDNSTRRAAVDRSAARQGQENEHPSVA
jgi:hypothetical protein